MKWLILLVLALPTVFFSLLSPSVAVEDRVRFGEVVPVLNNQKGTVPVPFNVTFNKDFYLSFWLRSDESPRDEMVMSKVDFDVLEKPGMALRFTRIGDEIRPQVYWRNKDKGGWYTFSPIRYEPKKWMLFLISFRENQYLGLHVAYEADEKEAKIFSLGGYKVDFFPRSEALLSVGKVTTRGFCGEVGSVLVFQGGSKESFDVLKSIVKDPNRVPTKEPIFDGALIVESKKE